MTSAPATPSCPCSPCTSANSSKLDIGLTKEGVADAPRQIIVPGIVGMASKPSFVVTVEGVEALEDATCLVEIGINLQQGCFYDRPGWGRSALQTRLLFSTTLKAKSAMHRRSRPSASRHARYWRTS